MHIKNCFFRLQKGRETVLNSVLRNNEKNSALFHANSGAIAFSRAERYAMRSRHAMALRALKTALCALFRAILREGF